MTHRTNAITHTHEYTLLPGVVRHTFIIFGLFTKPNLCPLTQNPGDATARRPGRLNFGLQLQSLDWNFRPVATIRHEEAVASSFHASFKLFETQINEKLCKKKTIWQKESYKPVAVVVRLRSIPML